MMKEIIEAYFNQRSLVNHQLASYDDCVPSSDGSEVRLNRMENIVRNIRVGTDEIMDDGLGLSLIHI